MSDPERRPGARRAEAPARTLTAESSVLVVVVLLVVVLGLVLLARSVVSDTQRQRDALTGTGGAVPAQAGNEAVDAAARVLDTWSQPTRGYRDWWLSLRPLLTPGGREAYAYTDPSQVPDLGKISAQDVTVNPAGTAATVYFTTAGGRFGVDLSRRGAPGQWLANRVVFPGGESMFR
ncbi:MAG: hypothetical protein WB767_16670 [Nocardioides sp.]